MDLIAARRRKAAFTRAQRQAEAADGRVCGTYGVDGEPIYFVVDKDASDEDIRLRAFQVKHGRPMNRAEELLSAAQEGDFVRAYEAAMAHYYEGREAPQDVSDALS